MNVTIIGAGKMGEALARGMLSSGVVAPDELIFADIAELRVQALAAEFGAVGMTDNQKAVRNAAIVILAVKPKDITAVCAEISTTVANQAIIVSIAAGITLQQLKNALGREDAVIARAMPNTPCLVGAGAIGLSFFGDVSDEARALVMQLLEPTGIVELIPESLIDAVTGLSGSGPAYIAMLIEAMADGGVMMGLPRTQAQRLAAQTVLGTAKLVLDSGLHPAQIKDAVASPGGTTIAGIGMLEDAGFRAAIISAVKAATMRAQALSGE